MDQVKFFKGCLPQILLDPLLNTLTQIKQLFCEHVWKLFCFCFSIFNCNCQNFQFWWQAFYNRGPYHVETSPLKQLIPSISGNFIVSLLDFLPKSKAYHIGLILEPCYRKDISTRPKIIIINYNYNHNL